MDIRWTIDFKNKESQELEEAIQRFHYAFIGSDSERYAARKIALYLNTARALHRIKIDPADAPEEDKQGDYIIETISVWNDVTKSFEDMTYAIYGYAEFARGKDGTCAFCHGDPCAELDQEANINVYFRLNKWAETCPVCEGRPT